MSPAGCNSSRLKIQRQDLGQKFVNRKRMKVQLESLLALHILPNNPIAVAIWATIVVTDIFAFKQQQLQCFLDIVRACELQRLLPSHFLTSYSVIPPLAENFGPRKITSVLW